MQKIVVVRLNEGAEYDKFVKEVPEGAILFDEFVSRKKVENPTLYSFWFDSESPNWNSPPHDDYNWMFLRNQQNWANDMLRARGHIFLNEILNMLGIPVTSAGSVLGWYYERDNQDGVNYVDFGCWDDQGEIQKRTEGAILLSFNPDGPIFQKL